MTHIPVHPDDLADAPIVNTHRAVFTRRGLSLTEIQLPERLGRPALFSPNAARAAVDHSGKAFT
jgi:hypothetical protein